MAGTGPLRMKRHSYRGATSTPPRWHRPAGNYDPREVYLKVVALCGYELDGFRPIDWSTAAKRPASSLCKICESRAETSRMVNRTTISEGGE